MTHAQRIYFFGRGASSCHGSTSRALATFAIQSSVALLEQRRMLNICARDTPPKSASAVSVTFFPRAVARMFFASSVRRARGSTHANVGKGQDDRL
jgi:hypothetical protein